MRNNDSLDWWHESKTLDEVAEIMTPMLEKLTDEEYQGILEAVETLPTKYINEYGEKIPYEVWQDELHHIQEARINGTQTIHGYDK